MAKGIRQKCRKNGTGIDKFGIGIETDKYDVELKLTK